MAISMNWVRDYVDYKDVDLKEVADKITRAGINIEQVESKYIPNLVTGEVISCEMHPDSDHLKVCQVNVGDHKEQIVCGAGNVRTGIKVIVALPGAILPGDFEIKASKIRGVESNGMICALFELGLEEKTEESYNRGIEELDPATPVGVDVCKHFGWDDTCYTLDLNPNRSDCNNHIPFSYEVAAVLGEKVTLPDITTHPVKETIDGKLNLKIETDNCPMYNAKIVTDVKIGPSPEFIKHRLEVAGMRSINNVVDISNYVMLEYGQPLHFFDRDKLGDTILVRMAEDQEKIVTLDGKERNLSKDDIIITDGKKPVCIAGVMGGLNSGIDENTKSIVIESAIFDSYHVRYTSINHELRSEASLRYEKGLNYEYCTMAIERACHLLEKYADAKVLSGTMTHDVMDKTPKEVTFTLRQVNDLLGMELTKQDALKSLDGLGFEYEVNKDEFHVTIPNRRLDVEAHVSDLAEEIGRLYGYDHIESKLPTGEGRPGRYIGLVADRKLVSKRLRSLGLNEARTYTLISPEEDQLFRYHHQTPIALLRPMSTDKSIIRQTLLPSLVKTVEYNKARGTKDVCLYEIANTYFNEEEEDTLVSIAMMGNYLTPTWQGAKMKVDFYLIKGIVEDIFDYMGLKNRYTFVKEATPDLHPGMSAKILLDREEVGVIGRVHPSVMKDELYVAEFSLKKLASKKIKPIKFKEISKYPSVTKDMAFVVSKKVPAEELLAQIKKSGGRLLTDIHIFDVYVGENVGQDEKSIAFSLTFQDPNKTLQDDEVMKVFNKIISDVEHKLGAVLRDK